MSVESTSSTDAVILDDIDRDLLTAEFVTLHYDDGNCSVAKITAGSTMYHHLWRDVAFRAGMPVAGCRCEFIDGNRLNLSRSNLRTVKRVRVRAQVTHQQVERSQSERYDEPRAYRPQWGTSPFKSADVIRLKRTLDGKH